MTRYETCKPTIFVTCINAVRFVRYIKIYCVIDRILSGLMFLENLRFIVDRNIHFFQ
jgi:hypothetical protein